MRCICKVIAALVVIVGVMYPIPVLATSATDSAQEGLRRAGGGEADKSLSAETFIANGVKVLLFIAAALAVVMIVLGGMRYVASQGQDAQIKAAKNTILYAIIGLVIAIFAYAIVDFVIDRV